MCASAIVAGIVRVVAAAAQWGPLPCVPLFIGDAVCNETVVAIPPGHEAADHARPDEGDGPVTR